VSAAAVATEVPVRAVRWAYRSLRPAADGWEAPVPTAREFRVLGPLEVHVDGVPVGLGGQRRRALLARLLLDPNRAVLAERLLEDLWGERARPTTANALQVAVSALRSALDPGKEGVLTHTAGGYLLRVLPGELDVVRFDEVVTQGRGQLAAGDAEAAIAAFDQALALHRGLPLADLAGEPCAQPEVERLVEARHGVAEDRIEALLAAGRHVAAVPELERLVREEPLRERRWAQLLLALYRGGRQADALRAFTSVRELLAEELGVDPSPALRDLELAILEHRPELDLRPGRLTGSPGTPGTTTVVFTDIVGSTELAEALGDPAYERLRTAHVAQVRALVAEHGGAEVHPTGDGLLLRFASATRAVRCGVAVQRVAEGGPVGVRVGIDAGEPVETPDADLIGSSINRAARLCAAAEPGEVLVSSVVRSLVEPRNEHRFGHPRALFLKGFAAVQEGHPVLWDVEQGPGGGDRHSPRRRRRHPAPLVAVDEYVGRDAELAEARAAWRHARDGGRVVLAVTGEPGAGKTRLCAELSRVAAAAGAPVAYGRCEPDGGGHQPVARALAHLVEDLEDAELRAALGGLAPDLAAVVPEVAARFPGLTPSRSAEPHLQRLRVADAVDRVVRAAGGAVPTLVVLDDLQWADGAAAGVLRHLGGGEGPLLLVAAFRDTDIDRSSPVVGALADLRRQGRVRDIHLRGLDPEEVGRCVQARAGRACTPSVAQAVHARTAGNPLFVEELTRALVAADALDDEDAVLAGLAVPTGVQDLVAQRLPGLGPTTTTVLEAAAIVGKELDWEVLPGMTGSTEDEVVDALDRAVAVGILVEVRGTVGRYAFAHDLVRQALYEGLGAARRSALHRRAAEALRVLPSAGAADVAHHLVRGATTATAQEAALAAMVAAEDAVGRVAHEEAARWYAEALDVLGPLAGDEQRALLLLGRGEALGAAGDRGAAVDALWSAAAAAREADDAVGLARAALALSGPSMGAWVAYGAEDAELVGLLDEAAAALADSDPALRARVLACRAVCRAVADQATAARDAAEALSLAEATGDRLALRSALFGSHHTSRGPVAVDGRLAIADRLLGLLDESSHPTDVLDALQLRLGDLVELGRLEQADALVARIEGLAEEASDVVARWSVLRYRAMRLALAGRLAEAEAVAFAAHEAGQAVQPANAVGSLGALLSMIRYLRGQVDGFAAQVQALAESNPGVSSYRALVPFFAAAEGDLDRAAASLRANLLAGIPVDNNWLSSHVFLAVACHAVGDTESAVQLDRALAPCAGLHAAAGSWVASIGPVDRALALLAETRGDDEAADRHAAEAEAWCRQVGGRAHLAVVLLEQGRRALVRDRAVALPMLHEARSIADSMGAGLVITGVDGLLGGRD
jgi:DNA-binding SARP family transcriptional activator